MRGWVVGILILAVTLLSPNLAFSGILAVLAAYAFARFIRMDSAFLDSGFYTYNPLLVGLSIGYLFRLTPLTGFFVITAGIGAFVLTLLLYSLFSTYLRLPVLSLPFVAVSATAYLAAAQYSNLYVTSLYPRYVSLLDLQLPDWLAGFFQSLGAVFFLPTVPAGLVFALVLLASSRILFGLSIAGYFTGALILGWLDGSPASAFANPNGFNFILIAVSVGGVFLIPAPRSYALGLIAVALSTVVLSSAETIGAQYGLPVFALPFNLTALALLYVLGLVRYPLVAQVVRRTPEQTLDEYLTNQQRYPGSTRTLALPFSGIWTVWQGFDGQWTHQGAWRYAYDFLMKDEDGNTHSGAGDVLEQYHAFRKPVLSPVAGRVVQTVDHLPDNAIGDTDRANNWGNLVLIQDQRGFCVQLSHLAAKSIRVSAGDWVERGALLGLCGNSGYSPQPHIHVQVMATGSIGAPTLPFSFVRYAVDATFHANDLPQEGERVEALVSDKALDLRTAFVLDETFRYRVQVAGRKAGELSLVVRMDTDGTFYLDSGKGRLYFGTHEGTFYHYRIDGRDPYLKYFMIALPRLPLAFRNGMRWRDSVPVGMVASRARSVAVLGLRSLFHGLARATVECAFTGRERVVGQVDGAGALNLHLETEAELDAHRGVRRVTVGAVTITKIEKDVAQTSPPGAGGAGPLDGG